MKAVCVFCGASIGKDSVYVEIAQQMGEILAQQQIRLIYGGGSVGLMGVVADSVLAAGGEVTGIIPKHLSSKEILHPKLQELHVTDDLFVRKKMMMELSDGFIALPGGLGTLDEILEVCTWQQLKQLDKPIGLLNTQGYYEPFLAMLDVAVNEGFLRAEQKNKLLVETDPLTLLKRLDIS